MPYLFSIILLLYIRLWGTHAYAFEFLFSADFRDFQNELIANKISKILFFFLIIDVIWFLRIWWSLNFFFWLSLFRYWMASLTSISNHVSSLLSLLGHVYSMCRSQFRKNASETCPGLSLSTLKLISDSENYLNKTVWNICTAWVYDCYIYYLSYQVCK